VDSPGYQQTVEILFRVFRFFVDTARSGRRSPLPFIVHKTRVYFRNHCLGLSVRRIIQWYTGNYLSKL